MVAFDLLSGLSIRAIHRMALIPGPCQRRVVGECISLSRRPAAVMLRFCADTHITYKVKLRTE